MYGNTNIDQLFLVTFIWFLDFLFVHIIIFYVTCPIPSISQALLPFNLHSSHLRVDAIISSLFQDEDSKKSSNMTDDRTQLRLLRFFMTALLLFSDQTHF